MTLPEQIAEAVAVIRDHTDLELEVALILGSGLGKLADEVENSVVLPYAKIPHFPVSTAPGHAGELVLGLLQGRAVGVMRGRVHLYEGVSLQKMTFPLRVMHALGARVLVVTNSAGGINPNFSPGDLMLISDHMNMMGDNPLIGPNYDELGPRFPPMARAYDAELRRRARRLASQIGIDLKEGVYTALAGPSYETPAEIRFLDRVGSDAVGMSTVPETIVANHAGMRVLGISCITNVLHQGPSNDTHEDVLHEARSASSRLIALVRGMMDRLSEGEGN